MTRILLDPQELRAGASRLEQTAADYNLIALRLRTLPQPEMPPGVAFAVSTAIAGASGTLAGEVWPMIGEAADLRRRARWAEISGEPGKEQRGLGLIRQNGAWLKYGVAQGLALLGPGGVLPSLIATSKGYQLVPRGNYALAYGSRFRGDSLLAKYLTSGRLAGTRYRIDNPQVARSLRLGPALAARGREFIPLDRSFLRAAGKGSGPVALVLTLGGSAYDFSPKGKYARKGYASSDFLATMTVDVGLVGGTAAAGTGAGILSVALAGGAAGSFVPGLGTVVGFVVAGGIGFVVMTSPGQRVRTELIRGTKAGIDFAGRNPNVLAPVIPGLGPGLYVVDNRGRIVEGFGGALELTRDAGGDALKALRRAGRLRSSILKWP